jgi:succinate dehydrogenase / fumarate reductase, membrane anchor subunit
MSDNFGSKRVVVGAHYGLRDWLMQRVTAALMAFFTLLVLLQVLFTSGPVTYEVWAGIFAAQWMKALTFVVFIALAWHAWVGMRDIWMDYIKPVGLRLALHVVTIVWLTACLGWAVQALWRL